MTTLTIDSVVIQDLERATAGDQNRHGEYMGHGIAAVALVAGQQHRPVTAKHETALIGRAIDQLQIHGSGRAG